MVTITNSKYMASEYVLNYGDYQYNYTYLEDIEFYQKIENILAKIDECNYILREDEITDTETRNQTMNKEDSIKRVDRKSVCGIEHADLKEAMEYVQDGFQNDWKILNSLNHLILKAHLQTFQNGNKILCTTYLKTNLIYDLETNTAGINGKRLNSFTGIFYHDWRGRMSADNSTDYSMDYSTDNSTDYSTFDSRDYSTDYSTDNSTDYDALFDYRYAWFQVVTSEKLPGFTIPPVMVDVMFEILSINERKIQDSLNITDSIFLK